MNAKPNSKTLILVVYTGLENSDTKFQFDRYGCMMELYEKNNILGQTKSPGCPGSY